GDLPGGLGDEVSVERGIHGRPSIASCGAAGSANRGGKSACPVHAQAPWMSRGGFMTRDGEVGVGTGGWAGGGRAGVRALGRGGARRGLIAGGKDGLLGAQREVEAAGGAALVLPADVADPAAVEAAATAVEQAFGKIDVWVNNAMVSVFSPIKQMTADEF